MAKAPTNPVAPFWTFPDLLLGARNIEHTWSSKATSDASSAVKQESVPFCPVRSVRRTKARRADLSWIWPTHAPRRRGILLVILTCLLAWPTLSHATDRKAHSHQTPECFLLRAVNIRHFSACRGGCAVPYCFWLLECKHSFPGACAWQSACPAPESLHLMRSRCAIDVFKQAAGDSCQWLQDPTVLRSYPRPPSRYPHHVDVCSPVRLRRDLGRHGDARHGGGVLGGRTFHPRAAHW